MNDFFTADVSTVDPDVGNAIDAEVRRQTNGLELIASENFVSEAVLQAMGTVFTNKYAEGYPGKRYYGGCEFADVVEQLAIDRAKELFGAEHANVQPHSGSGDPGWRPGSSSPRTGSQSMRAATSTSAKSATPSTRACSTIRFRGGCGRCRSCRNVEDHPDRDD